MTQPHEHASPAVIVIVNFNSGQYLARCLASIAEHARDARVIVVDNASTDGSDRAAETALGDVAIVRNDRNRGFAAAVNQGVRMSRADEGLIMLLNPDCQLLAGAADRLREELEIHPDCAIVGPQVLNENGGVQGSVRTDPTLLTGLFGRSSLLTRLFPSSPLARRNLRSDLTDAGTNATAIVDWVSGACMMIRRTAFDSVNGMDERYFLYWEDADLCRRLRGLGFTTRYVPGARVIHRGGVSSRSARSLALRAFHRSAYIYYASHVRRGVLARAFSCVVLQARCAWKLTVWRARLGRPNDLSFAGDPDESQ